jgi:hypothetical protein
MHVLKNNYHVTSVGYTQVGDGVASLKLLCTTAQDGKSANNQRSVCATFIAICLAFVRCARNYPTAITKTSTYCSSRIICKMLALIV